jgi:hypothetical protein
LIAYDAHALVTNGKKAKLNDPDDIIGNGKNSARDSTPKIGRASRYKGVYLNKPAGNYACKIHLKRKSHHLGTYVLETDAAWAYDECLCQLRSSPVHFTSKSEYHDARNREAHRRGIVVSCSDVQEYVDQKVRAVVSAADNEER